jgi:hypothetical protein
MRRSPSDRNAMARPAYVDFRLDWVVELARLERATSTRRFNAIENLLSLLTRQWRGGSELRVARDVRLSERTARALAGWVETKGPATGETLSVTTGDVVDEAVPDGWIRLLLTEPELGSQS